MREEARALSIGSLVLLALGVFVALRIEVTTDITHFLPGGRADPDLTLARELAVGELSRTMVLLVDAGTTGEAVEAGRELEAALLDDPRVAERIAFLESGPPEDVEEALWRLYQPRRLAFFAAGAEEVVASTSDEALAATSATLKERLGSPLSGLVSRVAPGDPTLILPRLFERLAGGRGAGLGLVDGRFVTEDGRAAVLFLGTRAASTDAAAHRPLFAGLEDAFERVARDHEGRIALSSSGAHRFALRAEAAIHADIRRVSIGSAIGLTLMFLLLFRSLRLVLLILPVVGAGYLAGTSACLFLFGSVHGLTLAFGAAMVGVSVDYAVHFHCHQTMAPHPGGPRRTLAGIWSGLSLSAWTTTVGFVALCASTFPGLREMTVFGATGIPAALYATRLFLPGLSVQAPPTWAARRLVARIGALLSPAGGAKTALLALPAVLVAILSVIGLPRVRWNDSIADLNRLDDDLLAEDEAVRSRVVRFEQRRLIVASAADEQAALEVNDRLARVLEDAERDGILAASRSLATLLPSARRQREVDAAVRASEDLWPRLGAALGREGFRVEGFEPFREALAAPAPDPLTFEELASSPLASLARPFRVTVDGGVAFVSFLHDLRDEAALRRRLEPIAGAHLIDVQQVLSDAYGEYRKRMTWLLLVGLLAVLALVAARHRALRPTVVACAPALLAGAGTIATLSLFGVPLNMLSLVALLMVVSMGVDYGVLLAETERDSAELGATHLAVLVAACSTMLGFGLLAFSEQPPLFSIGATAGIGVLLSLVLAPTLYALAGVEKRPS